MPHAPHRTRSHRRGALAVGLLGLTALGLVAGCGDDASRSVTSLSAADCPFSGSADPIEGGAEGGPRTALTAVETDKDGCVDVVVLRLDGGPGRWTAAYTDGPVTGDEGEVALDATEALVVTVEGAVSSLDAGEAATVATGPLDYVEEIAVVSSPDADLQVVLGMDERLPFEIGEVDGGEGLEVRTG